MAVDIGAEAINRLSTASSGSTEVNEEVTASEAGNVTSIDIWAKTDITGLKIGVFYATNGDTLKCRSVASVAGTITAGSKVNKVVSLSVEIGDYLGCYFTGGTLERSSYGADGRWVLVGDHCVIDDENTYTHAAIQATSLGGYIEEVVAAGRSFGFIIG